jgi:hypothetical protein
MNAVSNTRDPAFAALIEELGAAKTQAENSASELSKARTALAAAIAAIDDAHVKNELEIEARADALSTGDDRPDRPLVDIAELEAAAEVQKRLIGKLETIKKRDDEAFRELNQAVASARTALARRHCDEAEFGWSMDEDGDQRPRKLAWLPETTLGALAALWGAHGLASGDRGPRGTFGQFVQDWLSEPSFDDREAARLAARKAAAID